MEDVYEKISKFSLGKFGEFFSQIPKIISSPSRFFESIDSTDKGFVKASTFALVAASLMAILSTPSYKIHSISLEPSFYVIDIIICWLLFATYAIQTWFVCRVFMGRGGVIPTISAFFYSISVLVFVKMFEIPSRIIRDEELVGCNLTSETADKMSQAVYSNTYASSSEIYVGIGYFIFFIILINLVKTIHDFGVLRSIFVSAISLYTISITVSYVQRPVFGALLCAFKQHV